MNRLMPTTEPAMVTGETITDSMAAMLADIGTGREVHAPNPSVRGALWRRRFVTTRLIGMRWWWMQPTTAGRAALAAWNARQGGAR